MVLNILVSCNDAEKNRVPKVHTVSAMKKVMWSGELEGKVRMDTLQQPGYYGLGPESFLKGELLLWNGTAYTSRYATDSTMTVQKNATATAPFFVYSHVKEWDSLPLPSHLRNAKELETFLLNHVKDSATPFAFQLKGTIETATIHVQNLPEGTQVRSPQEAHQGQVNYVLEHTPATILGFFSTKHQGVFTHHDSFLHLHLMTKDQTFMGHVDEVLFQSQGMMLYLPKGMEISSKK